jgi:hypothetical protein
MTHFREIRPGKGERTIDLFDIVCGIKWHLADFHLEITRLTGADGGGGIDEQQRKAEALLNGLQGLDQSGLGSWELGLDKQWLRNCVFQRGVRVMLRLEIFCWS